MLTAGGDWRTIDLGGRSCGTVLTPATATPITARDNESTSMNEGCVYSRCVTRMR